MEQDQGQILNELERDALSELVNLGVSKAAANLRAMVADEVLLSVPSVTVVSRAEASRLINEYETGRLVAIHQRFSGDLQGRALLIFPEVNSLELVRAVTGGGTSLDDIVDLEQEALSETGNIILNGCLGTIGNMLRRSLHVSLPEILRGDSSDLLAIGGDQGHEQVVLFLLSTFHCANARTWIHRYVDGLASPHIVARSDQAAYTGCRTRWILFMSSRDQTLYNNFLNTLDAGIIVLDRDGRVVLWNDWIAAASTNPASSTVGKLLSDVFPRIVGTRLASAIDDSLRFGTSSILTHSLHNAIFPLSTSTGKTMIHNVAIRPVVGVAHSCLIQVTDVTIPAERDKILRERQNARYDAVVSSAPDAIVTLSTDGLIQAANPAATKQFGYLGSELIGTQVEALFENSDQWSSYWNSLLTSSSPASPVELKGLRKNGSATYLEISGAAWQSHSRLFVTVILRDVNARRAAEDALRQANLTLEQRVAERTADRERMWRLSTDLMLVTTLDGVITAINPAWRVFLGWDEAELTGSPLVDFIAGEDRAKWEAAFSDLLRSRIPRICEVRVTSRAGSSRIIAWSAVVGHNFVQAAGRDVTAERDAEESLRHAEEALRQSQKMDAIGQLTGGIAHDFNNLLMGIMGAMSMIKRRIAAGRNEDVTSLLDAGISSATRAAALVHRLLAFARQQTLDPRPLSVNQLIDGMMDLMRRSLGEQISLDGKLSAGLWPVMTDANQLENALLNLVINSRDAMPAGGRLTIETSNITIGKSEGPPKGGIEAGDYAVISVSDTGSGMPPNVVAKVFDPFFTTKPLGQGTGLGLSMVYGFVKQSNGHIQIESEVDKGTTIELFFPRHKGEIAGELPAASPEAPRGAGETVLLVEDDSSVRMLIADVLRDLGYACVEAHDGLAALPILNSSMRLDLLITDVGLPGLNGRQVADIGRQRRPDLKVLFVTGYTAQATVRSGFLEAGMDMITKPFNLDDLAIKIRAMIE